MSSSALATGVRYLRGVVALHGRDQENDEQLLHAFISRRDDSAFAALVRRHGPMVMNVCRRVLGQQQDAEDAFQATFLVLARKAAVLRDKSALAAFLHGTAYRMAMKAKQSAARRRGHESQAISRPPVDPVDELSWREVRTLLDEEIVRLPEKYRSVFVLCILEGVSREEAAKRLGLKAGTVSSRLTMARKRLEQRLEHRGVELTAVLAATAVVTSPASALPIGLIARTIKAALAAAAGENLAGIVSASIAELVQSGTAAMMAGKAKMATLLLLAVSMLGGASTWAYRCLAASTFTQSAPSTEPRAAKADDKPRTPSPKREAAEAVKIQGRVLDPEGKPKARAKIAALGDGGKPQQLGTTGEDGRFSIAVPKETKGSHLIAQADGFGIDFLDYPKSDPKKPIVFRLVKDRVIRGRIVNTEGKPVAGVRVAATNLGIYANNSMSSFLVAWKKRHFMSGIPWGVRNIGSELSAYFVTATDSEGRFVLRGLGTERLVTLRLSKAGIADEDLRIVNRGGFDHKPYNQASLDNIPKGQEHLGLRWLLHGPDFSAIVEAEKILRGAVKDTDTGKGRSGIVVRLTRREGGALLRVTPEARTDAQGRYEMHGVRKSPSYMLEVAGDTAEGYFPVQVWASDSAGYDPINADIPVKKGVIVTGKMIDGTTRQPVHGFVVAGIPNGNPFVKDYPAFDGAASFPFHDTGADGTFRVVAIPGPVLLMGGPKDWMVLSRYKSPVADPKYPQYFDSRISNFPAYITAGGGISPVQGCYCKVLEIKPGSKIVEQDIVLERASTLSVQIQDAEGKPLTDVCVGGSTSQDWYPVSRCKEATCTAYDVQPGKPRLMVFFHSARKLAGTLTLKGDEKKPVVVKLGPAGSIKGRLLDADGKPLAGVSVGVAHYHQRVASEVHNVIHHAKQAVTDATGAFMVDELIPGQKFELSLQFGKRKFECTPKPANSAIEVKPGEGHDLGTIKLKRIPETAGE